MNTEPSQAQAEPQTASAAAPAAGSETITPDTSGMTLEQLDTLFTGGSVEVPGQQVVEDGKAEPAQAAEAEAPTGVEPPAAAEPPAEPGAATEPPVVEPKVVEDPPAGTEPPTAVAKTEDPDGDKAKRFRVKDPLAKAALELYKTFEDTETPITLAEAERRVRGEAAPAAAPAEPEPPAATAEPEAGSVQVLEQSVGTLTAEVDSIKQRLEEAGASEGLYNADIAKLTTELTEKTADLRDAKRDLKEAQQRDQAAIQTERARSEQARTASHATAIELFPDAANKSTELGKAVAARIVAMKDPKHADHAILFADSAPLTIVRNVAAELGIAPKAKASAPPPAAAAKPPEPPPPAPPRVTPAPGNKTSVPPVKPAEAAKTLDYYREEASLQELDALFGSGNVSTLLAGAAR